ncbi:uncharacterized protein J8A68_004054 [[Candida] subhashii]|uniref:DUF7082 domain-containing protein n=1 Tax=[Candida] subhashii TaxID=561895 RepID=A0A8J5QBX7_9ASCO|nr:uncharacterized protein J8A68_004054 [[Candida] subhashii]KAG7662406.1 hypothetical protein J8A68_004054 [[Candida] subhashii]
MLDPTDPNQLNDFSLSMNTTNYLLDEPVEDNVLLNYMTSTINYAQDNNSEGVPALALQQQPQASQVPINGAVLGLMSATNLDPSGNSSSESSYNAGQSYYGSYIESQQQSYRSASSSIYSDPPQKQQTFVAQKGIDSVDYNANSSNTTPIHDNSNIASSMNSLFDTNTAHSLSYNYQPTSQFNSVISPRINFEIPPHQFPQHPTAAAIPSVHDNIQYSNGQARQNPRKRSVSYYSSPSIKSEAGTPQLGMTTKRRYRVVRGVSAGGCTTRPPKESIDSTSLYLPTELNLVGASVDDICYPKWTKSEKEDRRRIIRIERIQNGPKLLANFTIVGGANENPITLPPPPNVDVVEVSCLECNVKVNDFESPYDSQSSDDEGMTGGNNSPKNYIKSDANGEYYQYYITSVEVVEIVELLIGTQTKDPAEKRRERGRVRSNLVPFWSKKPISSRMNENGTMQQSHSSVPTNQDYRVELAKRIMGYEIRKPRGFDKEVRILRWDKLVPALKRALQSYYTEIPQCDAHLQF